MIGSRKVFLRQNVTYFSRFFFFFLLKNLLYASAQAENKQNFKSTVKKTYPGWESVKNDFILPIFFLCFFFVCVWEKYK